MKSLLGWLSLTVLWKFVSSVFVLLLFTFLFVHIFSINDVHAQNNYDNLSSEAKIVYLLNDNVLEGEITFEISSSSDYPTVVNYYKIPLNFTGLSRVEVKDSDKQYYASKAENDEWTELVVDLDEKVIRNGNPYSFKVTFQIDNFLSKAPGNEGVDDTSLSIEELTKKIILPVHLSVDTTVRSIQVAYPLSWGKPKYSSFEYQKFERIGNHMNIFFKDISDKDSSLTFILGNSISYDFALSKTVENNDDTANRIYEINIPRSQFNQSLTLSHIDPLPSSAKIDRENNIFLIYDIPPLKAVNINIKGNVKIDESSIFDLDISSRELLVEEQQYWEVTDKDELNRLDFYLDSNDLNDTEKEKYQGIYNYVIDRLEMKSGISKNDNSDVTIKKFRIGAQGALERKGDNIPEDYADLMIALLRHNNIPSRLSIGYIIPTDYNQSGFFHYWVEAWDGNKWVVLDPALDDLYKDRDLLKTSSVDHISILSRGNDSVSPKLGFYQEEDYRFSLASNPPDISDSFTGSIRIDPATLFNAVLEGEITLINRGNTILQEFQFTEDLDDSTHNMEIINKVLLPGESYTGKLFWDNKEFKEYYINNSEDLDISQGILIARNIKGEEVSYPLTYRSKIEGFWWWKWFIKTMSILGFLIFVWLTLKIVGLYNKNKFKKRFSEIQN